MGISDDPQIVAVAQVLMKLLMEKGSKQVLILFEDDKDVVSISSHPEEAAKHIAKFFAENELDSNGTLEIYLGKPSG
jgi:C4-dicarboxylate-specific signal transduction histidine kinase